MGSLTRVVRLLCSALAVTAISAPAAHAVQFHSEVESTTLKATQVGTDVVTFNAGTVKCNEAIYFGSQATLTASSIELEPVYSECTSFGFAGSIVNVNGCRYRTTNLSGASPPYSASLDIVCPAGKAITVVSKLAGTTKCTVEIPPQTGLTKKSVEPGSGTGSKRNLIVTIGLTGIAYSQKAGNGIGACKTEEGLSNGTYTGEEEIRGFEGEIQKGIWVE